MNKTSGQNDVKTALAVPCLLGGENVIVQTPLSRSKATCSCVNSRIQGTPPLEKYFSRTGYGACHTPCPIKA